MSDAGSIRAEGGSDRFLNNGVYTDVSRCRRL